MAQSGIKTAKRRLHERKLLNMVRLLYVWRSLSREGAVERSVPRVILVQDVNVPVIEPDPTLTTGVNRTRDTNAAYTENKCTEAQWT